MRGTGRRWGLVLLALLVVLNGFVLALLLRSNDLPAATEPQPSIPSVVSPTGTASEPADALAPTASEPAEPAIEPARLASRQLVAVDGNVAWRSTLASCGQGTAIVERTVNGGESWEPVDLELNSVVRLRATEESSAFAVGAGVDCATALVTTSDGGQAWTRADASLSSAWYLAPTDRSIVHGPRGEAPVPCPTGAIDLAASDVQQGAVLCQDGSFAVSSDGGQNWSVTVSIAGARALTQVDDGFAVATFEGTCESLSLYGLTNDGQAQTDPFACAPSSPSGDIAVSAVGDQVWVWSGADLSVSRDGGQTW